MAKDELDGFEARLRALFEEHVGDDDGAVPPAAAPKPNRAAEPDSSEVKDDFFTSLLQDRASRENEGRPGREPTESVATPGRASPAKPKTTRPKGGAFTTLFQPQASKGGRAKSGQESAPHRAATRTTTARQSSRAQGRGKEVPKNLLRLVASWRKRARSFGRTAAPQPESQPAKPTKRKRRRGFIWFVETLLRPLLLLAIVGGAAHALYSYLFPREEPASLLAVQPVEMEAVQPNPVVQTPEETPAQLPVEPEGEFAIQVAMCFLPTCVSEFREKLSQQNLAMRVDERSATQETVEVYSETAFTTQPEAAALADSINREFRMHDQVYVFADSNEFHISMGSFADLARAESFTDVLNQRFQDRATFAPRIRSSSYMMKVIVAGSFTSRRLAEAALARLVAADSAFAESYVVRR